jgi:predicted nucleotidyltransferase
LIDVDTERAARSFLDRIAGRYDIAGAVLYGSRARGDHREDSDADLAVLLRGRKGNVFSIGGDMAEVAADVLLDTGILVQALPIWLEDWEHPEGFSNPYLIEDIRREGVPL